LKPDPLDPPKIWTELGERNEAPRQRTGRDEPLVEKTAPITPSSKLQKLSPTRLHPSSGATGKLPLGTTMAHVATCTCCVHAVQPAMEEDCVFDMVPFGEYFASVTVTFFGRSGDWTYYEGNRPEWNRCSIYGVEHTL
jgi:hypothetical protein